MTDRQNENPVQPDLEISDDTAHAEGTQERAQQLLRQRLEQGGEEQEYTASEKIARAHMRELADTYDKQLEQAEITRLDKTSKEMRGLGPSQRLEYLVKMAQQDVMKAIALVRRLGDENAHEIDAFHDLLLENEELRRKVLELNPKK